MPSCQGGASVSSAAHAGGCIRKQSDVRFATKWETCNNYGRCEQQRFSSDSCFFFIRRDFSPKPWMLVGNLYFDFLQSWPRMEVSSHSESTAESLGRQQARLKAEEVPQWGAEGRGLETEPKGLAGLSRWWKGRGVSRYGDFLGNADFRTRICEAGRKLSQGEETEGLELGREDDGCSCKSKGNLCRRWAQIRGPWRKRKRRNIQKGRKEI